MLVKIATADAFVVEQLMAQLNNVKVLGCNGRETRYLDPVDGVCVHSFSRDRKLLDSAIKLWNIRVEFEPFVGWKARVVDETGVERLVEAAERELAISKAVLAAIYGLEADLRPLEQICESTVGGFY